MQTNEGQRGDLDSSAESGQSTSNVATDAERTTETDDLPTKRGFKAGVGAFLVGYVFTYLYKSGEVSDAFGGSQLSSQGSEPETWQVIGWFFMTMHHVTIEIASSSQSVTVGAEDLEEGWLILVPIAALLVAGYLVVTRTPDHVDVSGPKAGATIVAGYFVCVVAVAFLSEWTTTINSTTVTIAPKLGEAMVVAGVGYPIVLGAIGGAIGES